MTGVILVIDELIDQGIVMQLDSSVILQRISSKGDAIVGGPDQPQAAAGSGFMSMFGGSQPQAQEQSSSMFSSMFSSARSQISKTLSH